MPDSRPRLSILVVDDYPDTAESTADLLALYGHVVRVALTGEEALRLVADSMPDVVLLETGLHGADGYALARTLGASATGKPPLVVALTSGGTEADRTRAKANGIHLHLVKPVDPALLVGLMRRFRDALAPTPVPRGTDAADTQCWSCCHAHLG